MTRAAARVWRLTPAIALPCLLACGKSAVGSAASDEINTMSAKVDGTAWSSRYQSATFESATGTGTLTGAPSTFYGEITIYTPSLQEGTYRLGSRVDSGQGKAQYFQSMYSICETTAGEEFTGHVTISSYDRAARSVMGSFAFRGHCWRVGDTVSVTDGRFFLSVENR